MVDPTRPSLSTMKALLIGNMRGAWRGMSTLEILIAFAILTLSITAIIVVVFSNQSIAVDIQTNDEALSKAEAALESARATSRSTSGFNSINTTAPISDVSGSLTYTKTLTVQDLTACKKQATSTVSWTTGARTLSIDLTTFLSDPAGLIAMGGDCDVNPLLGGWNPPVRYASDTINPGKFNTLDALQKIVYLGGDHIPYFYIADTRTTPFGATHASNPSIITFSNAFNSSGKVLDEVNDVDAYKDLATGKTYAFLATASTTAQLVVLDVTDIQNPVIAKNTLNVLAKRRLNGITATDSTAWGWKVYYYDKKVYITTRETAGPELHVFDVSDPTNPTEDPLMGGGSKELNTTVNDFVVRDGLAYFAVSSDARGPLLVYDVSNPASITELTGARGNITGTANGLSIYLIGNKLYLGRGKNSAGNEFYILDASSPRTAIGGLPIFGAADANKEMNTDITGIRVAGRFAFLATYANNNGGLKVWDITTPENIQSINVTFNFGNKPVSIDFDSNFLYSGSEATPNFQMLYSP